MAAKKEKNATGKMTFEETIKELTAIVGKIEQGRIPLQDSLQQYERAMALINHCRTILQQAEKRIEKISHAQPEDPPSLKLRRAGRGQAAEDKE